MHRAALFIVTALVEVGTGLLLLVLPTVPLDLLLGDEGEAASPEAVFISRVTGAALLAIGVACWMGRNDRAGPAQLGLVAGVLIYDVTAAGLLVYAALILRMVGLALWPAFALHSALAVWCAGCLRKDTREAD
jgi:hypothetical protein